MNKAEEKNELEILYEYAERTLASETKKPAEQRDEQLIDECGETMLFCREELKKRGLSSAHAERRSRFPWLAAAAATILLGIAAAVVIAVLPSLHLEAGRDTPSQEIAAEPSAAPVDTGLDIASLPLNGDVSASYEGRIDSIDDLMELSTLVAIAEPVAVESESQLGVCWVMKASRASKEGAEEFRLRQVKDESLLKMGREYLLVLQPDEGEGYYCIPGGVYGLFKIEPGSSAVSGKMLGPLLESVGYEGPQDELTPEAVFDMLTGR